MMLFCLIFATVSVSCVLSNPTRYEQGPPRRPPKPPAPSCEKLSYRQSPVNIIQADTVQTSIHPLIFKNYKTPTRGFVLANTGHTLQLTTTTASEKLQVGGGNLYTAYDLLQLHFHWGENDYVGSEHLVDGQTYPLELHMVHIKQGNTHYTKMNEPDAIHVIGVLFKLAPYDNPELDVLLAHIERIKQAGTNVTLENPIIVANLLPVDRQRFWRYWGSLTTEPYAEEVVWTVLHQHSLVSSRQLAQLRSLHESEGDSDHTISSNYRETQPLNGRTIYFSEFNTDESFADLYPQQVST